MIYYWLHILYLFIGSKLIWGKVDFKEKLARTRWVSLLDCDALNYMANSKYLYYMDFIRFELLFRSSLYRSTVKKGMFPVLGSQKIIYKKPIKRWTTFTITLVLEGWDDKWAYHQQIFEQNNQVCAIGFTKVAFWKNKEAQNMFEILQEAGAAESVRKIRDEVRQIFENDYYLLDNKSNITKALLNN
jgi:acyl-CoA thioesterase FadM